MKFLSAPILTREELSMEGSSDPNINPGEAVHMRNMEKIAQAQMRMNHEFSQYSLQIQHQTKIIAFVAAVTSLLLVITAVVSIVLNAHQKAPIVTVYKHQYRM